MSNEYFTPTGVPGVKSLGQSRPQRTQWNMVEDGFDKMPLLAGHALEFITVNAGGSALESIDAETAIERLFSGGDPPDVNFNDVDAVSIVTGVIRSGYDLGAIVELEINGDDEVVIDWTAAAYHNYTNTREHTIVFSNWPTVTDGYGQTILLTIRGGGDFTVFFLEDGFTLELPEGDVGVAFGGKTKILSSSVEAGLIFYKVIPSIIPHG